MVVTLLFGVPITYVLSYYSMRLNLALMIFTSLLGCWLRCLVNISFYFAVIGHFCIGFSFVFYRSIASRISSIWFAPHKRATSTAVMITFLLIGDALSIYLPNLPINTDHIKSH